MRVYRSTESPDIYADLGNSYLASIAMLPNGLAADEENDAAVSAQS